MGKECGAWVSRRLWGGGNTSPLKTTAWEARGRCAVYGWLAALTINYHFYCFLRRNCSMNLCTLIILVFFSILLISCTLYAS